MLIKKRKSWEISENETTPQHIYESRRNFIKGAGAIAAASTLAACRPARPGSEPSVEEVKVVPPENLEATTPPSEGQAEATPTTAPAATLTDELGNEVNTFDEITTYNNFYEFTTSKEGVHTMTDTFSSSPWEVEISGLVNNPGIWDMEKLLSSFDQEERIYRMRCVEGWSMVIPWQGFPLAKLLKEVEPTSAAKYVKFQTLYDPDQFPGQRGAFSAYDWPYTEGLRLDEAMNDLTLMVTGLYGEQLLPQNGAPIRLMSPWKYGLKGVKSIVSIELTAEQPNTLWNTANPREYGFYSNVNPNVNHPRWSQASERPIGQFGRKPTLMFNGYEEQVASMYEGMDLSVFY